MTKPALKPTNPPIQWIMGLFLGVKASGASSWQLSSICGRGYNTSAWRGTTPPFIWQTFCGDGWWKYLRCDRVYGDLEASDLHGTRVSCLAASTYKIMNRFTLTVQSKYVKRWAQTWIHHPRQIPFAWVICESRKDQKQHNTQNKAVFLLATLNKLCPVSKFSSHHLQHQTKLSPWKRAVLRKHKPNWWEKTTPET
jgi:hypothetical protein